MDTNVPLVTAVTSIISIVAGLIIARITGKSNEKIAKEEKVTPSYMELDSRNSILERMNTAKGNLIWRLEGYINDLLSIIITHKLQIPPKPDDLDDLRKKAWNKD